MSTSSCENLIMEFVEQSAHNILQSNDICLVHANALAIHSTIENHLKRKKDENNDLNFNLIKKKKINRKKTARDLIFSKLQNYIKENHLPQNYKIQRGKLILPISKLFQNLKYIAELKNDNYKELSSEEKVEFLLSILKDETFKVNQEFTNCLSINCP